MTRQVQGHITGVLVSLAATSCEQADSPEDRLAWLREHAVEVRTVDPNDEDFTALEPLSDAIGDARVVLLGEASHGDGATFLAKGGLVKFLHQVKGFDVLVWESGFYECATAGEMLARSGRWGDAFEVAVLDLWSKSEQCQPVMKYVHATQGTDRPITLVGMSWYVNEDSALFQEVIAFFEAADPALPTGAQRRALVSIQKFLAGRGTRGFPQTAVKPPELAHVEAMIDLMARDPGGRLRGKHGRRKVGFMGMALENLDGYVRYLNRPRTKGGADDNPIGDLEGRSAIFLARDHFPERKLIIWAHNGHLARASSQIEELDAKFKFNETIAAGQHIHDALGDAVYSIMFTAHGGQTGLWWNEPGALAAPLAGSLEDLMHRAGLERAFVDLRRLPAEHWLRGRLVARPVAHSTMRADWSRVYDGVFFIDTMTPSTSADPDP
ncbi:MAG: erythromycin esterase family protein [Planctomycetota bacterium]|jgi:erythromycin esterase